MFYVFKGGWGETDEYGGILVDFIAFKVGIKRVKMIQKEDLQLYVIDFLLYTNSTRFIARYMISKIQLDRVITRLIKFN